MAGQEALVLLPVARIGREIEADEKVILIPDLNPLGPRLTPQHPQGGLRSSLDPAVPSCGQRNGVGEGCGGQAGGLGAKSKQCHLPQGPAALHRSSVFVLHPSPADLCWCCR